MSATWFDSYSLAYTVASLMNQLFGKAIRGPPVSLDILAGKRVLESVALLGERFHIEIELLMVQRCGRHFNEPNQPVLVIECERHQCLGGIPTPCSVAMRRQWSSFRVTSEADSTTERKTYLSSSRET